MRFVAKMGSSWIYTNILAGYQNVSRIPNGYLICQSAGHHNVCWILKCQQHVGWIQCNLGNVSQTLKCIMEFSRCQKTEYYTKTLDCKQYNSYCVHTYIFYIVIFFCNISKNMLTKQLYLYKQHFLYLFTNIHFNSNRFIYTRTHTHTHTYIYIYIIEETLVYKSLHIQSIHTLSPANIILQVIAYVKQIN